MEKEVQEILEQINQNEKIANKVNLKAVEVAEVLGCSQSSLNYWRGAALGPKYVKVPGTNGAKSQRVLYPKLSLARWLAQNMVKTA